MKFNFELRLSAFPVARVPHLVSVLAFSPCGALLGRNRKISTRKKGQNEREKLYRARRSGGLWTRFRLWLDGAGLCLSVSGRLLACPRGRVGERFFFEAENTAQEVSFLLPLVVPSLSFVAIQTVAKRTSTSDRPLLVFRFRLTSLRVVYPTATISESRFLCEALTRVVHLRLAIAEYCVFFFSRVFVEHTGEHFPSEPAGGERDAADTRWGW